MWNRKKNRKGTKIKRQLSLVAIVSLIVMAATVSWAVESANNTPVSVNIELYAKSGIWYDTLNILSEARLAQPEKISLKKEWADLLQQVELEHLAQETLTEQL